MDDTRIRPRLACLATNAFLANAILEVAFVPVDNEEVDADSRALLYRFIRPYRPNCPEDDEAPPLDEEMGPRRRGVSTVEGRWVVMGGVVHRRPIFHSFRSPSVHLVHLPFTFHACRLLASN